MYGTQSWPVFLRWYQSMLPDAVVDRDGAVDAVLIYRDIERAIDHAPDVAGPWLLMVQYLLPFDRATAEQIWSAFTERFLIRSREGTHAKVVPGSGVEDIRATCLAAWLAGEVEDHDHRAWLLRWIDSNYEPRYDENTGEFAYWFHLDEAFPRGQWNNVVMNAFVAPSGTWSRLLEFDAAEF